MEKPIIDDIDPDYNEIKMEDIYQLLGIFYELFYKNLVSIFLKLLIENLKENIMVNEYINKIDFASCLNVSEKKISLAIEKFNEKQKDQFIDKNKILLCEDSLNIFFKNFC